MTSFGRRWIEQLVVRYNVVVKGENGDTAWFAIIDRDRARLKAGYHAWMAPENFDELGR